MSETIEVRPFKGRDEYQRMVDYFVGATDAFLAGMGVDRARLPAREAWLEAVMRDHGRPPREKERAYLAWVLDGEAIGHSSINQIAVGKQAFIHLHLWRPERRRAGLGTTFIRMCAERFARDFGLERLYCEPYAENPAPNRVVTKAGFRFVERRRCIPGPINFEQDVNRYVMEFGAGGRA